MRQLLSKDNLYDVKHMNDTIAQLNYYVPKAHQKYNEIYQK